MSDTTPITLTATFRRRARTLRSLAYTVLALVAGSLAGGVYLFVIAGELTSRDVAQIQRETFQLLREQVQQVAPATSILLDNLRAAATESADTARRLDELIFESTRAVSEFGLTAAAIRDSLDSEQPQLADQLNSFIEPLNENAPAILENLRATSEILPGMFSDLAAVSAELRNIVDQAPDALQTFTTSAIAEAPQLSALFSTLTTRVGALLILVFLVQILINLYRYNIRLAAYYDARADALEIFAAGTFEGISMMELVRILSPEEVDFGKAPQSPVQHAVDLAREIIARNKTAP